jgi:DNA (cytosine-5)-methyltransferase 1
VIFGDLFSGIGGFRLGLERAGMTCSWACEIDPYCRKVYLKHWPDTNPFYEDIREVHDAPEVDLLCGGFPCTDISNLNVKGKGLAGSRSGLWYEFARLIGDIKPKGVLIENTASIRSKGLWRLLSDLDALGYDAEWHCIPACALGAPHVRDRAWIMAYPHGERLQASLQPGDIRTRHSQRQAMESARPSDEDFPDWNPTESQILRVAHGVPHRVDRLRALGNAVVPAVVQWLGERIIEAGQ